MLLPHHKCSQNTLTPLPRAGACCKQCSPTRCDLHAADQVSLPEPEYGDLDDCLRAACKAANLQATPVFMDKAHQLYEMVLVRHGLMVVGYSFAAKTSIYRMLAAALGDLHDKKLMDENK